MERLKAILEGTDLSIAEIRKEAFDFGRFLSNAENGRIGKYDAEKLSKYMFDKLKSKEAQIDKLQSKNVSYKVQILKAESQIKHKDEMGEDLKFIDFHQLQIENKKHVKDIDDRNKKLLKLKLDSGKIVQKLNALKKNLTEATKQQEELTRKLEDYNWSLAKKQQDVENTKKKIAASKEKNTIFRTMASMNKDKPKPLQFAQ